jgi:hypothetical protein
MKFLDRLLKNLATVIEIILLDVVAVSGRVETPRSTLVYAVRLPVLPSGRIGARSGQAATGAGPAQAYMAPDYRKLGAVPESRRSNLAAVRSASRVSGMLLSPLET